MTRAALHQLTAPEMTKQLVISIDVDERLKPHTLLRLILREKFVSAIVMDFSNAGLSYQSMQKAVQHLIGVGLNSIELELSVTSMIMLISSAATSYLYDAETV